MPSGFSNPCCQAEFICSLAVFPLAKIVFRKPGVLFLVNPYECSIDKNDFISSFIPTENDVLEYYNNNSDLFFEKEKRSFLQFNFKTLNKAEQFKKRIKNIITYEEVLSYANMKNIEYNVFDELGKDEIIEEIAQSLFKLKINEQSQIIKTPLAYHIVIMKNINPKSQLSFNEVRDDIIKTISNIDVNNFLLDLENEILEL